MTFQLSVVHGVKCTLVDPRPLKLSKQQHKLLKQMDRTAVLTTWTAEQMQEAEDTSVSTQQQDHAALLLQGRITQLHPQPEQQVVSPNPSPERQQEVEGLSQGDEAAQNTTSDKNVAPGLDDRANPDSVCSNAVQLHQVQGWFGTELWRSSGWQQLLGDCSLVIGLHPDQATEPIVDYALEAHKPFAVVPCCVFPRQFPNRQLLRDEGSVPVVTYADLIEYLGSKGHAQQHVLGFEGANTVLYQR